MDESASAKLAAFDPIGIAVVEFGPKLSTTDPPSASEPIARL
jgi:hypothetical protein